MKKNSLSIFQFLIGFILLVSLACSVALTDPTATPVKPTDTAAPAPTAVVEKPTQQLVIPPTRQPVQPRPTTEAPPADNGGSGGYTTFTDENNFYQIEVPSDWVYNHYVGDNYYIDQFKSPDEQALVENITYNNGEPFYGSSHGAFALDLLNTFYSFTGDVGDIRVTGDQIQPDGSERLEWLSKAGGYSGFTYFEVRGDDRTSFLMITIEWVDSAKDQYFDLLSEIISSYAVP